MPIFTVTILKDYPHEGNKIKAGMQVDLFCMHQYPTVYNGIYIDRAFMRTYGFDLKGHGWNNPEYMQVEEQDSSTPESLNRELELLKHEKDALLRSQQFEEMSKLRDYEKNLIERFEELKRRHGT